jgi:cephalosporin hydroxylase
MPRLGDITPGRGVPDWKQWSIQILQDLMGRVRGGQLMIAELQPMLVIECGIRSRPSCASIQVYYGMMKSSKSLPALSTASSDSREKAR